MPELESVVATPVPERKITVLLDRLNALLERTHEQPIDELEWQRLRQDARHLLKTDAREARMALGILAALRGDEADAEREFNAALAFGWTPVLALNRATMLAQFHRVEDALNEVMTVVKQGPDGPFYLPALREAAEWAYAVGRLHLAADLLASLQKQTNDPLPEGLADLADTLNRLLPTADAIGLTDDLMAAMQAPAWVLVHAQGFKERIRLRDVVYNDGDPFLCRTFVLPVAPDEILPLYEKLIAAHSAHEEPLPIWNFSVGLEALEGA